MMEIIAKKAGSTICKWLISELKVKRNLDGLNKLLTLMFNGIDSLGIKDVKFDFSSEFANNKLVTRSKCPIYKYCEVWCEKGCVEFISSFAKTFNRRISVRRVKKQPENDFCEFEFEI